MGWARDGRPRVPRFVILSFSFPLPFVSVSFRFRFRFLFSRFFWRLVHFADRSPPLAPPSFAPVRPHPSSRLFFAPHSPRLLATNGVSCPALVRLARWRRRRSPLLPP